MFKTTVIFVRRVVVEWQSLEVAAWEAARGSQMRPGGRWVGRPGSDGSYGEADFGDWENWKF